MTILYFFDIINQKNNNLIKYIKLGIVSVKLSHTITEKC